MLATEPCPTLCDPIDYSPPGSSVHGILQARILEWVVVKVTQSCLTLATPWTVACKVPLSMGFSRQEYWSGLPFPSSGDLSDPGIEPRSPMSPALAGEVFPPEPPGKPIASLLDLLPPTPTSCLSGSSQNTVFIFSLMIFFLS